VLDRKTGIPITLSVLYMEVARRAGLALQGVLNNLKGIYLKQADYRSCLAVVERLLILDPDSPSEIRDRGIVYFQLECFSQALADLELYLLAAPAAGDTETVREQVSGLRRFIEEMH
jgi:regulator of sirC expression with transglutaminase-like and TPR domain